MANDAGPIVLFPFLPVSGGAAGHPDVPPDGHFLGFLDVAAPPLGSKGIIDAAPPHTIASDPAFQPVESLILGLPWSENLPPPPLPSTHLPSAPPTDMGTNTQIVYQESLGVLEPEVITKRGPTLEAQIVPMVFPISEPVTNMPSQTAIRVATPTSSVGSTGFAPLAPVTAAQPTGTGTDGTKALPAFLSPEIGNTEPEIVRPEVHISSRESGPSGAKTIQQLPIHNDAGPSSKTIIAGAGHEGTTTITAEIPTTSKPAISGPRHIEDAAPILRPAATPLSPLISQETRQIPARHAALPMVQQATSLPLETVPTPQGQVPLVAGKSLLSPQTSPSISAPPAPLPGPRATNPLPEPARSLSGPPQLPLPVLPPGTAPMLLPLNPAPPALPIAGQSNAAAFALPNRPDQSSPPPPANRSHVMHPAKGPQQTQPIPVEAAAIPKLQSRPRATKSITHQQFSTPEQTPVPPAAVISSTTIPGAGIIRPDPVFAAPSPDIAEAPTADSTPAPNPGTPTRSPNSSDIQPVPVQSAPGGPEILAQTPMADGVDPVGYGEALPLQAPSFTPESRGISPDVPPPVRAEQVSAQITAQLVKTGPLADQNIPLELTLDPPELGKLRITVTRNEDGIMLNVNIERPETLDLMRRHATLLSQEFQRQGLENTGFNFSGHESGQPGKNNDTPTPSDTILPPETPPAAPASRPVSSGLDIRI